MSSIQNSWRYINLVDDLSHCLDMDRTGVSGQVIGNYISELIARSIMLQVNRGLQPDGKSLAPLSPRYRLWKTLHGFNPALLHKTNAMMSYSEVRGMVLLSTSEMRMYYGVTPECEAKADYAHQGRMQNGGMGHKVSKKGKISPGLNRPERPFYDISRECWEVIDLSLDLEVDGCIMSHGATRLP